MSEHFAPAMTRGGHRLYSDDQRVRLRELWEQGLSCAAIGRETGLSKNAVVGVLHRMGVERRPSPIRKNGPTKPAVLPAARRVVALPALASVDVALVAPAPSAPAVVARRVVAKAAPAAARVSQAAVVTAALVFSRASRCQWPEGHPREPGFRFCEAPVLLGRSYCPAHHARAFTPLRPRVQP